MNDPFEPYISETFYIDEKVLKFTEGTLYDYDSDKLSWINYIKNNEENDYGRAYEGRTYPTFDVRDNDFEITFTYKSNNEEFNFLRVGILTVTEQLHVSGISSFVGVATFHKDIDVDGLAELDDVDVTGILTTKDLHVSGISSFVGIATFGDIDVDGFANFDDLSNFADVDGFAGSADSADS